MNGSSTNGISYWKMVIFKVTNGYFVVVASGLCATDIISKRVAAVILCFVAGSKFLEGFFDQEVQKAKDNIKRDTELYYPANLLKAAATGTQPASKGSP